MTTINVIKNEKTLVIDIVGHANYKAKGSDIVCSAISSVSQYLLILAYDTDYLIKQSIDTGRLRIEIENCPSTRKWISSFEVFMRDLQEQYPENLKLNE